MPAPLVAVVGVVLVGLVVWLDRVIAHERGAAVEDRYRRAAKARYRDDPEEGACL